MHILCKLHVQYWTGIYQQFALKLHTVWHSLYECAMPVQVVVFAGQCTLGVTTCDPAAHLVCDPATSLCLVSHGYPCSYDTDCSAETCSVSNLCGVNDNTATFQNPYGFDTGCLDTSECVSPFVCAVQFNTTTNQKSCRVAKSWPCTANGDCVTGSCVTTDNISGLCA